MQPIGDKRLHGLALGLALFLLVFADASAAVRARLEHARIVEGDTVALRIEASGDPAEPDLAPLAEDFEVLDTAQSSQTRMVNGRSSQTRDWRLVLAPRRTGHLQIPPLRVGQETTSALSLEVVSADQADADGQPRQVILEVEVEPEQPYIHSRAIYRVRVLTSVPLRRASMSSPTSDDAVIQPLGKDRRNFSVQRDGDSYNVVERTYAVFPQRSGPVEIQAPVLSAAVPDDSTPVYGENRTDPFAGLNALGNLFERMRSVRRTARNLVLQVRPQPDSVSGDWLPAESISISEALSPDPPGFVVGEPVTRTITIEGSGVDPARLPDLILPDVRGLKLYADKPQVAERAVGNDIAVRKVIKVAMIPSAAGEVELPEVRIPWWSLSMDEPRVALLPARRVLVQAAQEPQPRPTPTPPQAIPSPSGSVDTRPDADQLNVPPPSAEEPLPVRTALRGALEQGSLWPVIAALLLVFWLATLWLWQRDARRADSGTRTHAPPSDAPVELGKARRAVERACLKGSEREVRTALLAWGSARWPQDPPAGLESLATRLGEGDAITDQCRELEARLYGRHKGDWDGAKLWRGLKPLLRASAASAPKPQSPTLAALYPGS